jgi:S1-C subfamily serine protease
METTRSSRTIFVITAIAVASLLFGCIGGVTGFVLLSSSDRPFVQKIRQSVGLDGDNAQVQVPVKQTVTLQENSALTDAVDKVLPSVVAVSVKQEVVDFFGNRSVRSGGGSGFILTSNGLIVTNRHVVSQAGSTTYSVVLNDGRVLDAVVKSVDPRNDLAILKVEGSSLPAVELGSSDALKVGQTVLAIGNPLGEFRNSVTSGIVSGTQRSISPSDGAGSSENLTDLIQTDAAINPGNSGGPLVNLAGQVVGINTAIASRSGGSDGVGFAIALDSVSNVLKNVVKNGGEIIRPYIGVSYQQITAAVKTQRNLPVEYGAYVQSVANESPAAKAGIKADDIILSVNGEKITENYSLIASLARLDVGQEVSLTVRTGTDERTIKVQLEALPKSS